MNAAPLRCLLFGLTLSAGLAATLVVVRPSSTPQPRYTVQHVLDGLLHQPKRWQGRTILVQGDVVGMGWSQTAAGWRGTIDLADNSGPQALSLRVMLGPENPVLGVLRRAPLLGGMIPPAQQMQAPGGVYRLLIPNKPVCPTASCHDHTLLSVKAILLDAPSVQAPV